MQRKGVTTNLDEIRLLRLLVDGPRYLAELERSESFSHVSALSAAMNLRKQRLIEFSYLKNSPLSITATGEKFLLFFCYFVSLPRRNSVP